MSVHLLSQLALGLGAITVNGTDVGWLSGDVEIKTKGDLIEAFKINPGRPSTCTQRSWTHCEAVLTASAAEINSANIGYFLLSSSTAEILPSYAIVFTHTKPDGGAITVTMTANIIPTGGMKFSGANFTLTGVEFRSVGQALCTIIATQASWTPPADLSDIPTGTTYSIAIGRIVVSTGHRVTIAGKLVNAGTLQV